MSVVLRQLQVQQNDIGSRRLDERSFTPQVGQRFFTIFDAMNHIPQTSPIDVPLHEYCVIMIVFNQQKVDSSWTHV